MLNAKHTMIELSYDDLKEHGNAMECGIIMFTEYTALLYYPENPSIRYVIKKKYEPFSQSDFKFLGKNFRIIGQGPEDIKSNFQMLIDDIVGNKGKLIFFSVLYVLLANQYVIDLSIISSINEVMIGVAGVYIGMLFVFVGFFYSDKERTMEMYKKGIGYKAYVTDRYIIGLSIVALALFSVSFMICNLELSNVPERIMSKPIMQIIESNNLIYWVAFILTYIAIAFLIIEFDTLLNYYLKDLRNKYFMEAFEEHIEKSKQ